MDQPLPHSFSHSPVEEVFCRLTFGYGAGSLCLAIQPPYPGWPHIRDRTREMIAGAGDVSRITGCTLRYTDLIQAIEEATVPGIKDIAYLLSGRFDCYAAQNGITLFRTNMPGTGGSVCSALNRPGKPGWTLAFTLHTSERVRFDSVDSAIRWFDDARAVIHELFDLIVPDEIVQILR